MRNGEKDDLTKQALIDKLRAIIDEEMQNPLEQIDDTLVAECADFLMELEGKEKLSDEAVKEKVAQIFSSDNKIKRKKRSFRALLIAACLALLLLIAVTAFKFDDLAAFRQLGRNLINMAIGEEATVGNISIIKCDDFFVVFNSLDEFLAEDRFDVLYPAALPGDLAVNSVSFSNQSDKKVLLFTITEEFNYNIRLDSNVSQACIDNSTSVETINGLKCYFVTADDICQCEFEYGSDAYTVLVPTYNDAIFILNNLKENKQ